MPPPLSVVLPVHDGMPYVEESIRSILAQSFPDFELVVGDDGSKDGTSETLARLAAEDSRIRVLRREQPSGLARAANWVVGEARAPLIAIAHADDRSHPDRLAAQMRVLRDDEGLALVGTLWTGIDESGHFVRPPDYWRLLAGGPFAAFSHSSIMFRRTAFERAGGYRPVADYWEDLDLYYRIAAIARITVLPFPYSVVRLSRASTMIRDPRERVERSIDLMLRTAEAVGAGRSPEGVTDAAGPAPERLNPLTFVRFGSANVWRARRPGTLRRLRERARLRLDVASLRALTWLAWGSVSPRSLRLFLQGTMHLRNAVAKPLLGRAPVAWTPGAGAARGASAKATSAATPRLEPPKVSA
jgi:hypothetical protein